MNRHAECLRCGEIRPLAQTAWQHDEPGECPRCGYLGWAPPSELSEPVRRELRMSPPEQRRLGLQLL